MELDNVQGIRYCAECGQPTPLDELAHFGEHMVCPNCKNAYAQKLREGVNPNVAVAGGFHYAGFWIRVLASIIDGVAVIFLMAVLAIVESLVQFLGLTITSRTQETMNPAAVLLGIVVWLVDMAIFFCYEPLFIYKMGATPGKMALGLKVIRPNGGAVALGRAFCRPLAKLLSAIILYIGYIMVAFDSEKRGLHDMICDTRVIKQRAS